MATELLESQRQPSMCGFAGPKSTGPVKRPFEFAAWLVDVDGTLYHQLPVRMMMALELAAVGRRSIRLLREFRREHERLHHEQLPTGANPFAVQLQRAAEKCGIDTEDAAQTIDEWMISRPGKWLRGFRRRTLIERIACFRGRGGRTAIVSDYPARKKIAAIGIESMFDAIVAVGEPHGPSQLKPSPAGMLLAADHLNVAPIDCLMIGDRRDADGAAAHRAGMQFLHVTSPWPA